MDRALATLIDGLRERTQTHIGAFRDGEIDADAFQQRMARDLVAHGVAAYQLATGETTLRAADQRVLRTALGDQMDYLNRFADDLVAAEDDAWTTAFEARAALYAGALTPLYSRGQTRGLDLPAYPTEGSPCITQCGCNWRLEPQDDGSTLAYWERGKDDSCDVCRQRAAEWNPYVVAGE